MKKNTYLNKEALPALNELAAVLKKHEGQSYKEWYRLLVEFKEGYVAGFKSVERHE